MLGSQQNLWPLCTTPLYHLWRVLWTILYWVLLIWNNPTWVVVGYAIFCSWWSCERIDRKTNKWAGGRFIFTTIRDAKCKTLTVFFLHARFLTIQISASCHCAQYFWFPCPNKFYTDNIRPRVNISSQVTYRRHACKYFLTTENKPSTFW